MSNVSINYSKTLSTKAIGNLNVGDYFIYSGTLYRIISLTETTVRAMNVSIPHIDFIPKNEQVVEVDIEVTVKYKN